MKRFRTGIYLLVLLLISYASLAAGNEQVMHTAGFHFASSFNEQEPTISLPSPESNIYHRLTNFQDKEFAFHARFKKKCKTKFLIQHLNFSQYIKKPSRQFILQDIDLLQEIHVFAPAKSWIIRPAYYTFLFRLSPF
jgi:hypothetical protein